MFVIGIQIDLVMWMTFTTSMSKSEIVSFSNATIQHLIQFVYRLFLFYAFFFLSLFCDYYS